LHELSQGTLSSFLDGGHVSKKETHHLRYIVGGVALGLLGSLMAAVMPDVRRYRRMCAM
jgi:hypothetical protein